MIRAYRGTLFVIFAPIACHVSLSHDETIGRTEWSSSGLQSHSYLFVLSFFFFLREPNDAKV